LKAVFYPRGGYWKPGGKFTPSIIAELGYIVEKHLISIGLLAKPKLDEGTRDCPLLGWSGGRSLRCKRSQGILKSSREQ
jgi:hypothetical protein